MEKFVLVLLRVIDIPLSVLVYPASWLLKNVRRAGVHRLPWCRGVLMNVGVFPIRNHYYEPQFNNASPQRPYSLDRNLPGINWNIDGQLEMLTRFACATELADISQEKAGKLDYYLNNRAFESGDAEYWYQLIRTVKPGRIIEIGSGHSTLMAIKAVQKNREESPDYKCEHICIEPYEMPWLEATAVTVIRKKVEDVELSFFSDLQENDILFIDSSHIIRPQGDVLFEYLELLPTLNRGVIVHIHDIFSPKNYLDRWLKDKVLFWNEQYLLEAFLSGNSEWKIIGALNFLHHNYYENLKAVAMHLTRNREPCSFYIQKAA